MAHQHQPTIATRPRSVANICRCDKKIMWDIPTGRWIVVSGNQSLPNA